jgi:pyruvate/2-oxoglutarate dehydrogenase complex dihydrolipoamide dehydrogenase (E3) component
MKFDAIIVGSGQAGNPLAYRLADMGWSVALIEKKNLGGTCINVGCTPTKTMVHRGQVAHYARNATRWGVNASSVSVDLAKIVAQKDEVVLSFRGGLQKQVDKRANLRLHRAHARFVGPHQLKAGDDLLESEKIFIDIGGRPSIPAIPGLDSVPYLTNETAMQLTSVPEHLLILGGGYIGLEFGQMFRRFGSRVTILHTGKQFVSREDPEIATELQKALEAEGVQFLLNARTTRVENKSSAITLAFESPAALRVSLARIFWSPPAAGPIPTISALRRPASKPTKMVISKSMAASKQMFPASGPSAIAKAARPSRISPTTIFKLWMEI